MRIYMAEIKRTVAAAFFEGRWCTVTKACDYLVHILKT
jgi:hypothetical protein